MLKRIVAVLAVVMALTGGSGAAANAPEEQLKGSINRILEVLRDPQFKAEQMRQERRNRIFKIVEERFDFNEMSKRSMGDSWPQLSEAEQKEFEIAFSNLLENSYISKIERYTEEKVNFVEVKPKGDKYFYARTEIVSGSAGKSIPVDYSLHEDKGQWMVYDVNVEGVSLITNYRSQFRETMRKEGFKGLMGKLNEKMRQMEQHPE